MKFATGYILGAGTVIACTSSFVVGTIFGGYVRGYSFKEHRYVSNWEQQRKEDKEDAEAGV